MPEATPVSLFILAGGLGSRFGGDKQIAELPDFGKSVMELSIEDAWTAGISRLVLIINQQIEATVREVILPRLPEGMTVELVIQRASNVPGDFADKAKDRHKPWGTGHALWCARHLLTGPSVLITADDYYGADAFRQMLRHFATRPETCAMVAYPLGQTLSANGGVNRGLCQVHDGQLQSVIEYLDIGQKDGQLVGQDPLGKQLQLAPDALASMTFWGLTPAIVSTLEQGLETFLNGYSGDNKQEFYLPDCIQQAINSGDIEVSVYTSIEPWFGMTYQSELAHISRQIRDVRQEQRD